MYRDQRRPICAFQRRRVGGLGEAMRIARFYQKTLFGVFAIIGLIVALTSVLYVYTVDRQLTGDLLKNSRSIARSIADSNVDLIVQRNYSALQSIIDQFVEISSISYVFVVDEKGAIIAHTFVPGVPGEILADYKSAKDVYDRTLAGLGNFSEVTEGMRCFKPPMRGSNSVLSMTPSV